MQRSAETDLYLSEVNK